MSKNKSIYLVGLVLLGLILVGGIVFASAKLQQNSKTQTSEFTGSVNWCIQYNPKDIYCFDKIEFKQGESAYDTFVRLDNNQDSITHGFKDYGELGKLVTKINNVEQQQAGNKYRYWQFMVNDQSSEVGAASHKAQNGENYKFVYGE
jgi:hypothetical protein